MEDIGHSSLLKFLVDNTMSEKNIESKVPGEHNIREVSDEVKEKETLSTEDKGHTSSSIDEQNSSLSEGNTSEIATADDFTLSPVITVTKNEATFTKGDLKLQKVTVTEDISHSSTSNEGEEKFNRRLTYEINTSIMQPKDNENDTKKEITDNQPKEKVTTDSKRLKTKIPMSRLRQAVNKVKDDIKEKKRLEKEKEIATSSRKSSIPRLIDTKIPKDNHTTKKDDNLISKADEEFDKIFQELNPNEYNSLEFINTNIDNVNQIENSFEELIHAYEDNNTQQTNTDKIKQSRIPLLKRKSEHEIEIPKTNERQALKKSNSVDTKIQTTIKQNINEKRIVSEQIKTHKQSNVTTKVYTVQKQEINNNIVSETETAFNNAQNQESYSNEIKETIKVAIPVFDIPTSDDKLKRKESIDNEEDLTQDITITKNLNFDKETVSKIYKIDFTENNFDSLDMTLLNESLKREQQEFQKETKESYNTKEGAESNVVKLQYEQSKTSSISNKTIESTNYNEILQHSSRIDSINTIKSNQTDNNYISKRTLEQSIKTNDASEKIEITNQSTVRQVSLETNKTETKATSVNSNDSTLTLIDNLKLNTETDKQVSCERTITTNIINENLEKTNDSANNNLDINNTTRVYTVKGGAKGETSEANVKETKTSANSETSLQTMTIEKSQNTYNQTVSQISVEGKIQNKTTEVNVNQITAESEEAVKSNERSDLKQELYTKTIENCDDQKFKRNVSHDENKTIKNLTSESATVRQFEKGETTKPELQKNILTDRDNISAEQVSLEEHASSTDKVSGTITQKTIERYKIDDKLDKVMNKTEIDTSSSKNYVTNKNTDIKENRLSIESSIQLLKTSESKQKEHVLNRTSSEDFSVKAIKTTEAENLKTNEEISIDFLKNKRNKSLKLEELSRRYENIEFDNTKKTSLEAYKSVENKITANTNNEKSNNSTDGNKNILTLDEVKSTKEVSNDSTKSISVLVNDDRTKRITDSKNSNLSSVHVSSVSNNQTVTNQFAASNTLNKTETSFNTNLTKSLTNLNTQSTEDMNKIYSEVFTKMNAQKQSLEVTQTKEEKQLKIKFNKNEKIDQDVKNKMEEEIPILKGKVNRVIQRISSIDNTKSVEKNANDLPKKISILSKIQMFERGEPDEVYPKTRIPKLDTKTTKIPHPFRQTSTELRKPKIVKEILKETNEYKTETTESKTTQKFIQEKAIKTAFNEIENNVTVDTKLKDDTKLLINNYKQVVQDINRKITEDNSTKYESKIEQAKQERDIKKTSLENSFDKNVIETKTEVNDFEITSKGESNTYTKIYRNDSELLNIKKYERINKEDEIIDTNENVFNFTPKENSNFTSISNKDTQNNESNTISKNKYTTEYKENESNSLEYITINTTKSYERLQSDHNRSDLNMRRTTSVAELEIGGVVKGRVYEMIKRINSMEILSQGKKEIQREQPRKSSVSEKIALFEGKLPPIKTEKKKEVYKMKNTTETSLENTEEYYAKKIEELQNVKNNFEVINTEYLELRDTSEMPVIALGTALLDKRIIKHVIEAAIDMGYRAIDTAFIYGNEKEIGEAINNKINDGTVKREDLYIISKLWSTYHRKDLVEKACRQSLDNMGLTYFDLYLIHNPMSLLEGSDPLPKIANVLQYSEHDYMDAWRGIEDLIVKGVVRRGGVSNFNSEQVHRVMEKARIKPVVNQVECHPYLSQERLGGFCDAYGMRLSCYGVLGSKGTPAEHKSDLPPVIEDPLVLVMAAGLGVTPGQMLIAYQLHNGRSVVIKASSAGHLYDNLKAQFISLEPSHLTALKSLNKNKRTYYLKGLGETHKNYPFNIAF